MTLMEALRSGTLLSDGAMGTQLQMAGLESGGCGEMWNLTFPERIQAIHERYVAAGSQLLTTNTFGGSRIMLERHMADPQVEAINRAAVRIARRAFGGKPGYVVGDIGPFGGLMEPLGEYTEEEVYRSFYEQAHALVSEGADAVIIETQTVLDELAIGIRAAKDAGAPCIIASMAFDLTLETKEIRTMMGTGPEEAVRFIRDTPVDIIAMNCGAGIDMGKAQEVVQIYRTLCDLPVMVQPNAGLPEIVAGKVIYNQTPDKMAEEARDLLRAQTINILGACCGSTPEHIAKLRQEIASL